MQFSFIKPNIQNHIAMNMMSMWCSELEIGEGLETRAKDMGTVISKDRR